MDVSLVLRALARRLGWQALLLVELLAALALVTASG